MADKEKQRDHELIHSPFYHGLLPREDIKLMVGQPGDWLVRMTEPSGPGRREYVISVCMDNNRNLKHYVISKNKEGKFQLMEKLSFDAIPDLVRHYQKEKIGDEGNVILKNIVQKAEWQLDHNDITLTKKLGEGAFGEVHRGTLEKVKRNGEKRTIDVAIKQAKLDAMTKEQVKEFMREARIMRQLEHPNIILMYGVAATQEPLMLVMALAKDGALDSYLVKHEPPIEKKTEMCIQAAFGIEHMHERNILHRDIAARNCLYGDGQVKLADFGLSRIGDSYQMNPKNRVPIRWLAPETLKTAAYSRKTDVWSYGVLAWEIYNNGADPYFPMSVAEVLKFVKGGNCLKLDDKAPKEVAELIEKSCFDVDAGKRQSMRFIVERLAKIAKISVLDVSGKKTKTVEANDDLRSSYNLGSGGASEMQPPPKMAGSIMLNPLDGSRKKRGDKDKEKEKKDDKKERSREENGGSTKGTELTTPKKTGSNKKRVKKSTLRNHQLT